MKCEGFLSPPVTVTMSSWEPAEEPGPADVLGGRGLSYLLVGGRFDHECAEASVLETGQSCPELYVRH